VEGVVEVSARRERIEVSVGDERGVFMISVAAELERRISMEGL